MAPNQKYFGKAAIKNNFHKNQARFGKVKLPENIKCYCCDQVKPANLELFSSATLLHVKKAIASADNSDEYRALLEKETTDEGFSCILCSDRPRTEMQCSDCDLWLGLDKFSKAQRKLYDEARCKGCMNAFLALGSPEEELQRGYQEEIREAKRQYDMELAHGTSADDDDDDDDAKTISSEVATIASADDIEPNGGLSVHTESESEWSVQTPPTENSTFETPAIADDGFIEVGPGKGKGKKWSHQHNWSSNNGWNNSNSRSAQHGWNNPNNRNNGNARGGWNNRNNGNPQNSKDWKPNGPKAPKTSKWAKRSDWQKPKIPNPWEEDIWEEDIDTLVEKYLDDGPPNPVRTVDPVTGIKW